MSDEVKEVTVAVPAVIFKRIKTLLRTAAEQELPWLAPQAIKDMQQECVALLKQVDTLK